MRLNDLAPKPGSKKRRRRLGRGISAGQGASCGQGMRGQKSRAGSGTRPGFEGGQTPLYRRIPKQKGFSGSKEKKFVEVNVRDLAKFPPHTRITLDYLIEQGGVNNQNKPLKILGDGDIKIPVYVEAHGFTKAAQKKIEQAGGSCHIIEYQEPVILPETSDTMSFLMDEAQYTVPWITLELEEKTETEVLPNTKTMSLAVIENKNADKNYVYQKYTVYTDWLDIELDRSSVLTATIPQVNNTYVLGDNQIAKQYLRDFIFNTDLEIFRLYREPRELYDFREYYSEFIDYTKTSFVKFKQFYWDYKIYSSLATVEIDEQKELLSMTLFLGVMGDPVIPYESDWISQEDTFNIVQEDGGVIDENTVLETLWYYDTLIQKWRLCYRLENIFISNEGDEENIDQMIEVYDYFIDVLDGNIVDKISRIQ